MTNNQLQSRLLHILDLARWAPSGDNTQPWRFEIIDAGRVVVHGFDTRDHCVYDLDGHPSQISIGALLETASIAASSVGMRMSAQRRLLRADGSAIPEERPTFELEFTPEPGLQADPLVSVIKVRSVQRRPLKTRALRSDEKQRLESCLPPGYSIHWLEGATKRWQVARLMFRSARIRLTIPEAYEVHRDIIEWNQRYSASKVPDQALGVDAMTLRLMRFVMQSWDRVAFFNRFFAGTVAPRIQMDLIPSLACAAHFALLSEHPPSSIDDYVSAGRAMQRFWLTASSLDLQMQPEITPLVFTRYASQARQFSRTPGAMDAAAEVRRRLQQLLTPELTQRAVFFGRVGAGPAPVARSERQPLDSLMMRTP